MRRRFLLGAVAVTLALAGCVGEGVSPAGSAASETSATPGGAFPVTIDHAHGSTVIEEEPERVGTLSASNQDVALALGVTPVAMPFVDYGGDAEGVLPWVRDAIEASGDPFPQVIGRSTNEVAVESIAAAEPDLILATYSGLTEAEYATLAEIAPTVAFPDAPFATSWQDQTRIAGQALGRSARAENLVSETEELLASAVQDYPQLRDKTFVYTGGVDGGALGVFRPTDVRVALLEDLGLTVAPYVEQNAPADESVYYTVSLELTQDIASDLVVGFFGTDELNADFLADPSVQRMPAIAAGGYAPIIGEDRVVASSAPSVLSIPWVLDDYLPVLAEAADRTG